MRNALLSVFLVISSLGADAQIHFNNVYDYFNQAEFARGVNTVNDSVNIIVSGSLNNTLFNHGVLFLKVDKNGSVIDSSYYYDPDLDYFEELTNSIHRMDSSTFYLAGTQIEISTLNPDVNLFFYDSNKDSVFSISYLTVALEFTRASDRTSDKGFVIIGGSAETINDNADWVIYKIDSIGNLLWRKVYGLGSYDEGENIFELPDKSLIASGIKNLTVNNETTWILKLDSAGNILKQKEFNMAPYKCTDGRFTFLNENYLMVGCLDTLYDVNDNPNPVYIAKLDTDFNVVWRTDFHGPQTRAISIPRQLPDSTIVFVGEKFTLTGVPFGWIVKLDKNGTVLWEHTYYKTLTIDNYFADFQQTADKGFIITGSAWGTTQDVWLVKLDSMGCLDPNDCTFNTGTVEVSNATTCISIYPNPASSEVTMSYNLPLSVNNAVVQVCDISGKLINEITIDAQMHEVFVNVNGWSNGIYLCNLLIEGHRIKSTKLLVNH
jgi:hypothetical protein